MPSVLGDALEGQIFCTSLDNTLRLGQLRPTEWVLCDNRMTYTEVALVMERGIFGAKAVICWPPRPNL